MEFAQLTAGLASLKHATDLARLAYDSKDILKDAEQRLKLAELLTTLADAKSSFADVKVDLIERDERIRALEALIEKRRKMTYEPPFYWIDEDGKRDGPFCQTCWDANSKTIRLQDFGRGYWGCHTCKSQVTDPKRRAERILHGDEAP